MVFDVSLIRTTAATDLELRTLNLKPRTLDGGFRKLGVPLGSLFHKDHRILGV